MNPNENNPTSPFGVGGASGGMNADSTSSSIPSPLDFTNPETMSSNSSLSMADSLASAQDNLTSAGQAAYAQDNNVPGLGQLGASSPSATMAAPNQPLKPADPVPGSIGSVTSVPAAKAEGASDVGVSNSMSTASAMPSMASAAPTATAPSMAGVTSSTMPTMKPAGGEATENSAVGGSTAAGVSSNASTAKPYYNPFARNGMSTSGGSANTATSSSAVPPALQPPVEKFSDRLAGAGKENKKGNSKLMTVLSWLLVLVLATTTVVFAILWQNALNEKEVVYIPTEEPNEPTPTEQVGVLSCTQDLGGAEENLENLVDHHRTMTARYKDGSLDTIDRLMVYNFTDHDAAEAARGHFDEIRAYFEGIGNNLGITPVIAETVVEDNVLNFDAVISSDLLMGEYIDVFGLARGEGDAPVTDKDGMQAHYEAEGYVCSFEEVAE